MEDNHILYADIIIACVQLRQTVGDNFFVQTFDTKLKNFINASGQADSRLQSVESLLELLAQLEHLNLGDQLQLLACRELLLKDKLSIIQKIKPTKLAKIKPAKEEKEMIPLPVRFPERTKKANQVREEILKFIQHNHQARTKDIVSQFSAISHRTIHRNLKELVNQGLVVRHSDDGGAIRYLAS
ncbi:MAG: hypothetical protein A3I39_01405 [Candidatus Yanofskybacteria bacterium RIFCSPLOWO2_02_FULL_47_9b]|uniref:HTH deoR-type domain-containing protein n=1 Tax=Candidatus Yanofskybacteria bacterium RIFCSPLOWO2_02_FULL_47_9b TaxID=1802708 RepID=A0A1F8H8J8_9BACT|nr:MAG: hypothetical protein A3I39_01405 [Candidatus Yanofskybacteria bacterium RIFCSPLOWO2_02_FULL_47_9b]